MKTDRRFALLSQKARPSWHSWQPFETDYITPGKACWDWPPPGRTHEGTPTTAWADGSECPSESAWQCQVSGARRAALGTPRGRTRRHDALRDGCIISMIIIIIVMIHGRDGMSWHRAMQCDVTQRGMEWCTIWQEVLRVESHDALDCISYMYTLWYVMISACCILIITKTAVIAMGKHWYDVMRCGYQ